MHFVRGLPAALGLMKEGAFIVVAALTLVVGCASTVAPEMGEAQCERSEGEWKPVCIAQELACVKSFKDAGKRCRDSSECEGECLVDLTVTCDAFGECSEEAEVPAPGSEVSGACQRNNDPCGSFVVVRGGKAERGFH